MGRFIFPTAEGNFPAASTAATRTLMGFSLPFPRITSGSGDVDDVQRGKGPSVAVIGAGAAGLGAGRLLRDEGLRVKIFEKSRHVGGVWRYDLSPKLKPPMCELPKGPLTALSE